MVFMFTITAKKRDEKVNLEILRKGGEIPAVFYGMGNPTTPITLSKVEFKKVWHKAGESSAVEIVVDGKKVDVLIHEVQTHPVNDEPIHVDFLAIDMNKKITVSVPLEFVGVSPAVKSGTGNLVKVMHEIEIEALPKDLPHNLEVDISSLVDTSSQVTVAQIKLPAGVVTTANATDVVASIIEQKEEVVEEVPVDLSAIEVEKKGKKEEEGEAQPTETKE
ncbi:MAG: large subunit ribosomal protein [Patescibacteria group bacterium]|nr:large subunit ribosomal protein [Patescibacteria group bacterium]